MSDQSPRDAFDVSAAEIPKPYSPLPEWLARRVLERDEEITWVCGPRFNPSWERYVTHPALLLLALLLGAWVMAAAWLSVGTDPEVTVAAAAAAGGIVLASIFVLGIFSGYFTRLVVTNYRLIIIQGYEVCRAWSIHRLPHSLIRYRDRGGEGENRSIDLEAVKTLLGGGASDKFTEAGKIMALGKRLDRITDLDNRRP